MQLTTPLYHLVDTQHLESQIASLGAARCIQYCPYDANLLLLGTQDDIKVRLIELNTSCFAPLIVELLYVVSEVCSACFALSCSPLFEFYDVQIWNLKENEAPVYSKKAPAPICALCWDPHGLGFYSADGETTAVRRRHDTSFQICL